MPANTKSTKKPASTECIGFVSGGILKANHLYVFSADTTDAKQYAKDNLVQYYGDVNGRYIKVSNASSVLNNFYKSIEDKSYVMNKDNKNILHCGVKEASEIMKQVTESKTIATFKFGDKTKQPTKKTKNDQSDDEQNNTQDKKSDNDEAPAQSNPKKPIKTPVYDSDPDTDTDAPQKKPTKAQANDSDSDAPQKKPTKTSAKTKAKTTAKAPTKTGKNGKQTKPPVKKPVSSDDEPVKDSDNDDSDDEQPKKPTKTPAKPQGKTVRIALTDSDSD